MDWDRGHFIRCTSITLIRTNWARGPDSYSPWLVTKCMRSLCVFQQVALWLCRVCANEMREVELRCFNAHQRLWHGFRSTLGLSCPKSTTDWTVDTLSADMSSVKVPLMCVITSAFCYVFQKSWWGSRSFCLTLKENVAETGFLTRQREELPVFVVTTRLL